MSVKGRASRYEVSQRSRRKRMLRDPEYVDRLMERYHRRKYRVQQRDQLVSQLRDAIYADRWLFVAIYVGVVGVVALLTWLGVIR